MFVPDLLCCVAGLHLCCGTLGLLQRECLARVLHCTCTIGWVVVHLLLHPRGCPALNEPTDQLTFTRAPEALVWWEVQHRSCAASCTAPGAGGVGGLHLIAAAWSGSHSMQLVHKLRLLGMRKCRTPPVMYRSLGSLQLLLVTACVQSRP